MRRNFRRVPVQDPVQQKFKTKTFPAPIRGLVLSENLAAPGPGGAVKLQNWRPTPTGLALRGGARRHATIGDGDPVTALLSYSSDTRKLFAANETDIYEVTAPVSPTVSPSAAVTGQTGGEYSFTHMTTAGGAFMVVVNGTDAVLNFDGSSWTTPTINNVTSADLSHVWLFKNRLFFVEGGTQDAWYLATDAIAGDASQLSLAGVFQRGGYLLFGGTWSLDAGDGIDDKCVFVSTNGEVVVYQGSDPSDPEMWAMVGRYEIGRPLGKNAWMRAGGDLLIATEEGAVAISAAIQKDRAALALASVSRNISPEWSTDAAARTLPWGIAKWDAKKIAIVAIPAVTGQDRYCRVVHLETGAWSTYTGWDAYSIVEHGGQVYFGTSDGKVMLAEAGGSDDGAPYVCTAVHSFDNFGAGGMTKQIKMARASFRATQPFTPKVSASINYTIDLPSAPDVYSETDTADAWDSGVWDVAVWNSTVDRFISSRWVSVNAIGFSAAVQIQVTCGSVTTPDAELISTDVVFQVGGLVV